MPRRVLKATTVPPPDPTIVGGLPVVPIKPGALGTGGDTVGVTKSGGAGGVSAAEQAIIAALGAAKGHGYLYLSSSASNGLIAAVVAAAQRPGMQVKTILDTSAGFDKTWLLQQHLESSGVDTDVQAKGPGSTFVTAANEAAFLAAMKQRPAPDPKAGLLPEEQIAIHPMPESGNKRIVELINASQESIDLSVYQLQDRDVIEALKQAAANGRQVRVMLEPKTVGASNYQMVAAELGAAGVQVKVTPPNFDSSHNVDHAKFMIIDGKEVAFGTGNLVRSGLGGVTEPEYNNRDFWTEDTRSDTIKDAVRLFNADWDRTPTTGEPFTNLIVTPDNALAATLAFIKNAQGHLYYFNQELEHPAVIAALIAKKRAEPNFDIRESLGYQPGFGGPPKNQAAVDQLKQGGIQDAVLLRTFYLHAKGMVDAVSVMLCSQNASKDGLEANREVGETLPGAAAANQVAGIFLADRKNNPPAA
jgi:phosphatidylserine/phosphatidylglycerophosphate/cardiolipin synthase-like enzyme